MRLSNFLEEHLKILELYFKDNPHAGICPKSPVQSYCSEGGKYPNCNTACRAMYESVKRVSE